jgi:hypothetical protein
MHMSGRVAGLIFAGRYLIIVGAAPVAAYPNPVVVTPDVVTLDPDRASIWRIAGVLDDWRRRTGAVLHHHFALHATSKQAACAQSKNCQGYVFHGR